MSMSVSAIISFDDTEVAFRRKSNKQLKRAYRLFKMLNIPWLATTGARISSSMVKMGLPIKGIVRGTVYEQFCGGETLDKSRPTINELAQDNVLTILDYGVEAKNNEDDFDHTAREMMLEIDFAKDNEHIPFISCKLTGLGRFAIYEKLHAGEKLTTSESEEFERVKNRINTLCEHAAKHSVGISIDAEETWIQQPIDELVHELMERYNHKEVVIFNTAQMYRKDRLEFLRKSVKEAKKKGYKYGIKLVRGAYMEKERERALELDYESPIHETKSEVDKDFDDAVRFCIENVETVSVCVATHNEASCKLFAKLVMDRDLDRQNPHLMCCQLYGMSDHITFNLAEHGFRSAKYVPYGPVKEVLPYLSRRAQENTSVGGQMSRELQLYQKEIERRGL